MGKPQQLTCDLVTGSDLASCGFNSAAAQSSSDSFDVVENIQNIIEFDFLFLTGGKCDPGGWLDV